MASLTGNLVAETYKALLKTIDNDILTASEKQITDGFGGGSNIFIDSQGFIRANKYKVTNGLATQFLKADGSLDTNTYLTSITGAQVITALGYTPVTNQRTLTINGVTYNLTANRTWTIEGTAAVWGNITGTLSNQTDLQNALNAKYNIPAGTITQYIRGDGSIANFPTLPGGLPTGGTAGQILAKIDATDYNAQWIDNFATQTKNEVKLGQTLTKGTAVYVSSANGTNMIVSAASNASEALSSKTFGLLETGGATNDLVKCVTFGLLAGLDTSAATAGDPVWLGVNGALLFGLANKPVAPANMVYIGVVTRVQSNNGEIFVNVQNGFEIEELHDVLIQSKVNNQGLFYESSTGLWKNKSITDALGFVPQRLDKMVSNLLASDTEYPNSNAVIAALALKANAENPVFTGNMTISGAEPRLIFTDTDQNPDYFIGADAGFFRIFDQTAGATRFVINSDGNISTGVSKSITAGSFIKDGGTASQFLKADGSIDSNTYAQSSALANYLLISTAASTYQRLDKMVSNLLPSSTEYPNSNAVINALALKADAANPVFTGFMTISGAEPRLYFVDTDNNPDYTIFIDSGIFYIYDQTAGATRFSIGTTGNINAGIGKSITAGSFIKDGGTASQFLKADGSIDSNTYVSSSALADYLLISTATSTYQRLDKMVSNLLPSSTEYPNSNAVINALALKANAANPVFTGNFTISGSEPRITFTDTDNDPDYFIGVDGGFFRIFDQAANITRFVINSSGNITTGINNTITSWGFVRSGGTSSQFLMADGSVSLGPVNGITGSGTATRVAFFDGTNSISSSSGLFWDNTNSRLSIGTSTPTTARLTLAANSDADAISLAGFQLLKWNNGDNLIFGGYQTSQWQQVKFFAGGTQQVQITTASANFENSIVVKGIYNVPSSSYFISGANGYRFNNSADTFNNVIMYDNGNTYTRGNVLIGTTTDSGFKLDVSGTGRFSNTLTATAGANTYAGGSLILRSSAGTNPIYLTSSSGFFALSNGGAADHLLINSTGAATFSSSVTATNNVTISSTSNASLVAATNSTTGYTFIDLINNGASGKNYQIGIAGNAAAAGYANNLYFDLVGVGNVMTLTSARQVLIGLSNTSEVTKLFVKQSQDFDYRGISIESAAAGGFFGSMSIDANGNLSFAQSYTGGSGSYKDIRFVTSNIERLRIGNGGNLTVKGTYHDFFTNSGNTLTFDMNSTRSRFYQQIIVDGTVNANGQLQANSVFVRNSTGATDIGYLGSRSDWTGGPSVLDMAIGTYRPSMCFFTNNSTTESMRITSTSNLLVGTTTDGGYRVDAAGMIRSFSANPLVVSMSSVGANDAVVAARWQGGTGIEMRYFPDLALCYLDSTYPATSGQVYGDIRMRINSGGTMIPVMTIKANNTSVGIGTTNPAFKLDVSGTGRFTGSVTATGFFESSDFRLKTLIDGNPIIKGIENLQAKLYEKDGKIELGYFAQDAELIMPYAVTKHMDGFLNLSYREIHTAKIARLEKEVAELKKQLNLN